jgi:L-fuculose-phosphate aldolase
MTLQQTLADQTVKAIKTLWSKNHLAAGDGNFSFKCDGEIWITPSGVRKCELSGNDFVKLGDSPNASSESLMHKTVFENAPEAKVVFHAHPTTAIAYSIANEESFLPEDLMSELILSVGRVPIVPYARPGSLSMGEVLLPHLPKSRVMILKHHGALSWGESVNEALSGMERLEHTCEILLKVKSFGGAVSKLPVDEIVWLNNKRKELGDRTL